MAHSAPRPGVLALLALGLGACPEPCPEDQLDVAPACAPVDRGAIALANSSFESVPDPLARWGLADAPGVVASLVPGVDGCVAVAFAREDGQPIAKPARFTTVLDATALRGQRVRLSLWARVEGAVNSPPGVALRASAGRRGALTDMRSVAMTGEGWRLHTVELDVPPTSDHLHVVVGLGRAARVAVDGVVLDRVGPACPGCDPPAPLSEQDLEDLSALTRLFGHVRYFNPSLEARSVDWDRLALAGVQAALAADGPAELAAALERVLRPVAPRLELTVGEPARPRTHEPAPQRPLVLVRRNDGPESALFPLASLAAELPPGTPLPSAGAAARLDLGRGLSARVPLAVDVLPDDLARVASPAIVLDKPHGFTPDLGDRVTRLAAIVALGARLQHFSARLDRQDDAFEDVLADSLRRAATATDRYQLREVVWRALAAIGEGAARAHVDDDAALTYSLALAWTWLDGQVVVTAVDPELAPDLRPGDVVEAIDGRAIDSLLAERLEVAWGATEARRRMIAASLARRASGTSSLQIRRLDGSEHHVKVRAIHNAFAPRRKRPAGLTDLPGGILHINLDTMTPDELRAASARIAGARGLVLDVRSGVEPGVMSLFRATLGDLGAPERRYMIWPERHINPLAPPPAPAPATEPLPLPTRLAVLVDGNTQGRAEALADALRHHRGALVVGEPTVGSPGPLATIDLPGGLKAAFTEAPWHHASGHPAFAPLLPDLAVADTREAIAAGRDEPLEQAVAALWR